MSPGCPGGLEEVVSGTWAVMGGRDSHWRPPTPRASPCSPLSLFPTMPRYNYHKVAPLVKALCAKHGLRYEVKSVPTALVDIIR